MVKLNNKGQSLPLNTIVIALLVVIVLVVIVLAFTSNIGNANNTINENGVTQCSETNPSLTALGYKGVSTSNQACSGDKIEIRNLRKNESGTVTYCCRNK